MLRQRLRLKLDFLIPGSPNDAFFSQIAFFRLCLDTLGGHYREARLVAVFGDKRISRLPVQWIRYFRDIEIEWASPEEFERSGSTAQSDRRFELVRDDADVVFLCDADVALLTPMDGLLETLVDKPALAGVIAHYHFPWPGRQGDPEVDWPELAANILGRSIDCNYRYTLLDMDAPVSAPFYINYGVLAGQPAMMKQFYKRDRTIRPRVADVLGPWWAPQVSLALTCVELEMPTVALPLRYNFPNDPRADELYPGELRHIVFLHYLRTEAFDRQKIFATKVQFDRFCRLNLKGSNLVFQDHVAQLTNEEYPFER